MLMLEKSDNYWFPMSDQAICELIGKFVKHHRLAKNLTQAELAHRCGVHRTTILDIEKGKSVSLLTIIQVLRILDQLQVFREFILQPEISPIMVADAMMKSKKRASKKSSDSNTLNDWL